MSEQVWWWGVPNADPGTHEFGPPLEAAAIQAWQARYGVTLPPELREAYGQQDGGIIRSQRCFFNRLEEVEPVGAGYFEELGAEPLPGIPPDLTFQFGYDDYVDCALFLAYRGTDDPDPQFYGYWTDGGSVAWAKSAAETMREPNPWRA